MESTIQRTVEVTLVLSFDEASWLRSVMQTSLGKSESDRDTTIREEFYEALRINPTPPSYE